MFCLLCALVWTTSMAQESSFQLVVGYGFSAGSQKLGENMTGSGATAVRTGVYGSLGAGFNLSASYRRMFNEHVGLDLGARYLFGNSFETTTTSGSSTSAFTDKFVSFANGFFIDPTFVLAAAAGKLKPYARVGFTIGFITATQENDVTVNLITWLAT